MQKPRELGVEMPEVSSCAFPLGTPGKWALFPMERKAEQKASQNRLGLRSHQKEGSEGDHHEVDAPNVSAYTLKTLGPNLQFGSALYNVGLHVALFKNVDNSVPRIEVKEML